MDTTNLCLGCMEPKGTSAICPRCGYNADAPPLKTYIEPGTVLGQRYLVGRLISYNAEGATYIAFDRETTCKVVLREFMPFAFCTRVSNKPIISVNVPDVAQYKTLMAEFTELHKTLARLSASGSSSCLNRIIGLFAENNTTYVVHDYAETVSLVEYTRENAGELSLEQVTKLFPAFFTSLNFIHGERVFHRGISPETIFVTKTGELKLAGFSVSALRTSGTVIQPELFHGYAAPEQYSISANQGTWTDIYAICAVLYRLLTGSKPTDSLQRSERDDLPSPSDINPNIAQNISDTIMQGLKIKGHERIQTVNELVAKLFETPVKVDMNKTGTFSAVRQKTTVMKTIQPADLTMLSPAPETRRRETRHVSGMEKTRNHSAREIREETLRYNEAKLSPAAEKQGSSIERIKIPLIIGVLLLAILLVLGVILNQVFGWIQSKPPAPSSSASSSDKIVSIITSSGTVTAKTESGPVKKPIGNLVDRLYSDYTMPDWTKDYVIMPHVEYNNVLNPDGTPKYPKNTIFRQSVEKGEYLPIDSTIEIWVSKGPSEINVPSPYFLDTVTNQYKQATLAEYKEMLKKVGIEEVMCTVDYYYNNDFNNGEVIETSLLKFNFTIYDTDTTGEYKLKIYVAQNSFSDWGGAEYLP